MGMEEGGNEVMSGTLSVEIEVRGQGTRKGKSTKTHFGQKCRSISTSEAS